MRTLILILSLLMFLNSSLYSQKNGPGTDQHPNKLIIRNDRVFLLNGVPFFPIGVCFDLGGTTYTNELKKPPPDGRPYGFNFINLFAQNLGLYQLNSLNVISGDIDRNSQYSSQYNDILGNYWGSITGPGNYNRIKSYLDNGVYLLADQTAFFSDDVSHYSWGTQDDITINPPFNQQIRNTSIDRINTLALQSDSKLIGFYSQDDANLFQAQGPQPPMYYYNNFRNTRIQNLYDSYNYAKSVYPKSMVLMSLPATFFPRRFDYNNWQDVNIARNAWVDDAIQFSRGANVLFAPGYMTYEDPSWSSYNRIYDIGYPKYYPQHIKETLIDRVLSTATEPKAILGGIIFDIWQSSPKPNDPKMDDKVKWEIYVGLQKGATGLIFFGWHVLPFGYNYRQVWDAIRHQVDTLANVKNLNNSVFTKTNLGPIGYMVNGSNTSGDVSYTIYNGNPSSWSDYYLLASNNPIGSLFAVDEGNNTINFRSNVHKFDGYNLTEVFSGNSVQPIDSKNFTYTLPWFGTALFHITNSSNKPYKEQYSIKNNAPNKFYIKQNYPNPFNPSTEINFGIPKDNFVTVDIYNSLGQLVKSLMKEYKSAGNYSVKFDGTDYSSGLYFYKIKAGDFTEIKKMLLVK